jgi:hypothetical protein
MKNPNGICRCLGAQGQESDLTDAHRGNRLAGKIGAKEKRGLEISASQDTNTRSGARRLKKKQLGSGGKANLRRR